MIPAFFYVRQVPVTVSTNADVKHLAEEGEAEGLVIHALRQTGGKGRHGRVWESPEGNLYMSLLLRPRCSAQQAGLYSFVAALAVHDAAHAFLPGAEIVLKWPNDVLVNGKKICGILLEAAPVENDLVDWLVVGIGVNVAHHPDNAMYPVTSLMAEGNVVARGCTPAFDVDAVRDSVLIHFENWRMTLQNERFSKLRTAWLAHARKGEMVARLPQETVAGTFKDLDDHGRLILRLPDGTERAIAAGDVFFRDQGSGNSDQESGGMTPCDSDPFSDP